MIQNCLQRSFAILALLSMSFCARQELSIDSLFLHIQENIQELPDKKNDASVSLLEESLESILSHPSFPMVSEEKMPVLLSAIENYQLGYFMHPTQKRLERLQKYYLLFDKNVKKEKYEEFYHLRALIASILKRSDQAKKSLPSLLSYWEKNPHFWSDFIPQLQPKWEVGGIVLNHPVEGWEILCLEDKEKPQYKRYLEEFQNNQFQNLGILEEKFLHRLALRKTGADRYTIAYSNVIIESAKEKFAIIRTLGQKKPLKEAEQEILEKAKKKLYFFGLERMILRHSYTMDIPKYMDHPNLVFFFHSHPHDPRITYKKKPSGQDETMTFRTGPMLVFDIQKDYIDIYSVILGESEQIKTIFF